jgi:hypothetical protein
MEISIQIPQPKPKLTAGSRGRAVYSVRARMFELSDREFEEL